MRGRSHPQTRLFFAIDVESRIRPHHPRGPLKKRVDVILRLMDDLVAQAVGAGLCRDDHFRVDGTIIESDASMKSVRPKAEHPDDDSGDSHSFKPRHPDVDFPGEKRSHDTQASRTDSEAKRDRKGPGKPSQGAHRGHVLSETATV